MSCVPGQVARVFVRCNGHMGVYPLVVWLFDGLTGLCSASTGLPYLTFS